MADAPTLETKIAANHEEWSRPRWWSVPLVSAGVAVVVVSWTVPAVEGWWGIIGLRMIAFFAVMLVGLELTLWPRRSRRAARWQKSPMTLAESIILFLESVLLLAGVGLAISAAVYGSMPTLREVLSFAPMGILVPLTFAVSGYIFTRRTGRGRACPKCGSWSIDTVGEAEPLPGSCTRCNLSPVVRVITARPSDVFGGSMWQMVPWMVTMFACLGVRPFVMSLIDAWFPGLVP